MQLLTKEIKTKAEKQYDQGGDMSQKVVAKFFDPVGSFTWYLMNKDPESGYCWGIVDGMAVEMGSFMIEELEEHTGHFGLGIERDTSFDPVEANTIWKMLNESE